MAEVVLEQVDKRFDRADVLAGIDLSIPDGEFCVIVGPSGCGKSTLLRIIAGLEDVSAGKVRIGGEDVTRMTPAERGIAMVFQSYALYPHMSVAQNITFGLEGARIARAEAGEKLSRVSRMLELDPLLDRKPADLSGGQRQRVAIGRAIVREPRAFLFDEPLSNLDAALRGQMRIELMQLHEQLGVTMIYVTHDQVEAMTMADKIVVLNAGRIEQVGTPLSLYYRPANLFVARFIGGQRMNTFATRIGEVAGEVARVALPDGAALLLDGAGGCSSGEEAVLGIRPEHVSLDGSGEAQLTGTVQMVEHLGSETILHVSIGSEVMVVRHPGFAGLKRGDACRLSIQAENVHLFSVQGAALRNGVPRRLADALAL